MDLPDPGIELGSSALQADSLTTELSGKPNFKKIKKLIQFFKPFFPLLQNRSITLMIKWHDLEDAIEHLASVFLPALVLSVVIKISRLSDCTQHTRQG